MPTIVRPKFVMKMAQSSYEIVLIIKSNCYKTYCADKYCCRKLETKQSKKLLLYFFIIIYIIAVCGTNAIMYRFAVLYGDKCFSASVVSVLVHFYLLALALSTSIQRPSGHCPKFVFRGRRRGHFVLQDIHTGHFLSQ